MLENIRMATKKWVRDLVVRLVGITIIIVGIAYPSLVWFGVIKNWDGGFHFLLSGVFGLSFLLLNFVYFWWEETRQRQ